MIATPDEPHRHDRGTWTPEVHPGSGGRRRRAEGADRGPGPEPTTFLPASDATTVTKASDATTVTKASDATVTQASDATVTRASDATVTRASDATTAVSATEAARTVATPTFPPTDGPGGSPHLAARIAAGARLTSRSPIRYDPAPGVPRRPAGAMWGPPIPVAGS